MSQANFGVREFVNLALFFLNFYLRHKDNIDDALGSTGATALTTLAGLMDEIRELNDFGPL